MAGIPGDRQAFCRARALAGSEIRPWHRYGLSCAPEDGRGGRQHPAPMSDTPPDHLAINPASPFHDAAALERGVGIRFNNVERDNVEEYSVSEGWVRVQAGKARDRRGNPMTIKVKGTVVAYYLDQKPEA
jgi:hypothetical protein